VGRSVGAIRLTEVGEGGDFHANPRHAYRLNSGLHSFSYRKICVNRSATLKIRFSHFSTIAHSNFAPVLTHSLIPAFRFNGVFTSSSRAARGGQGNRAGQDCVLRLAMPPTRSLIWPAVQSWRCSLSTPLHCGQQLSYRRASSTTPHMAGRKSWAFDDTCRLMNAWHISSKTLSLRRRLLSRTLLR
jgi:hypothetical protein